MTRTAPELAKFLGVTPRQLAAVLKYIHRAKYDAGNASYMPYDRREGTTGGKRHGRS